MSRPDDSPGLGPRGDLLPAESRGDPDEPHPDSHLTFTGVLAVGLLGTTASMALGGITATALSPNAGIAVAGVLNAITLIACFSACVTRVRYLRRRGRLGGDR